MLRGQLKHRSWHRASLSFFFWIVFPSLLPLPVAAQINDAAFISQSVPRTLQPGDTATVAVTMQNTGTTTWDPAANYFLGSQNPENNWTWGLPRVGLDGPVAPGQRKTFRFTITAPSTPGTYDFQWQMLQEYVEWFGDFSPNIAITVVAPANGALFIAQSVPTEMLPGATATVSITMRNSGGTTWRPADGYFLGSQNPENNYTWGLNRVALPGPIGPGQQTTFTFTITAPSAVGTYNFQWRMVQENVEWFGDATPNVAITVAGPTNGARFISQSVPPRMLPGGQASVSITMENSGTSTWRLADNYFLGSQNPENNWTWGLARVAPPGPIAPGQRATFTFTITAPSTANTYNFQWRMVQELVEWFGDATPNVAIQVGSPDDNAEIISHTIPTSMVSGMSYLVHVTVLNTGSSTWTRDGGGPADGSRGYKLVVIDGDLIPAGTRFPLPPRVEVRSGQTHTFEFTVVAPSIELATTSLQMIHEGIGLFGGVLRVSVEVKQEELTPSTISVSPTSGPPGTLVTVSLVEGNAFHRASEVVFSFGDPEAHFYSRVPVHTSWVSDTQLTFTVPPEAGCGRYFATVFAPAAPEVEVSKPTEFTVTGPCDPTRRNSLDVLSYNIAMLPDLAGWCYGYWTCETRDERATRIAEHADMQGHDVVIFVEAFSDSHRHQILTRLESEYPYRSRILGTDTFLDQDGGVIIASKWPIEVETQTVFEDCAGIIPDCRADKGVNYVRINKGGQRYHIFGTHFDSGDAEDDRIARGSQLRQMARFIDLLNIPADEPVIMGGDFNIDRYGRNPFYSEYELMLRTLDATQPPIVGLFRTTNPDGQWLDYVLYANAHRQPASASNRVLRFTYPWIYTYLSDHFAVQGSFLFSPIPRNMGAGCPAPPVELHVPTDPSGSVGTAGPTVPGAPADAAGSPTADVGGPSARQLPQPRGGGQASGCPSSGSGGNPSR